MIIYCMYTIKTVLKLDRFATKYVQKKTIILDIEMAHLMPIHLWNKENYAEK